MALVGGGGAGYTAGSNPAGISKGLNHIGNHAYAYSGAVSSDGSSAADTTALEFNTGSSYLVGFFSFQTTEVGGGACFIDLKIDAQTIIQVTWDGDSHGNRTQPLEIVLPPFADIEVLTGTANDRTITTQITGRIYA